MLELLAAIRKLRTALEHPVPDPDTPGITIIQLSEAALSVISSSKIGLFFRGI